MNCSPYLTLKTLRKPAKDDDEQILHAAEVLKHHIYVDDLIAGATNEADALQLQEQLIQVLHLDGFELRKWVYNLPSLLKNVPVAH